MNDKDADLAPAAELLGTIAQIRAHAELRGSTLHELAAEWKLEQATARDAGAIIQAIADARASIMRDTELRLLELRVAFEKANADMLLRLGGVMLCILTIVIAAARFLGLVY
jgi:hypothetical protein